MPDIVIKKVKKGGHGHHGGAWKVAYADFVTAMMAFFLLLWLLSSATEEQLQGVSNYFTPETISQNESGSGGVLGGTSLAEEGSSRSEFGAPQVSMDIPPVQTPEEREAIRVAAMEEQEFNEAKEELKPTKSARPARPANQPSDDDDDRGKDKRGKGARAPARSGDERQRGKLTVDQLLNREQRERVPRTGQRFAPQESQHGGRARTQQCLDPDDLARIALGHAARKRVVHAPGRGGQQHREQAEQLHASRQTLLDHQHRAAGQQQEHGRGNAPVQRLVVPAPGQYRGEHGFEREHQRGAGAAGALQAPGQRHRPHHRAHAGHGEQARQVGAAQLGFAAGRPPQHDRHDRRADVQQGGGGKRPQARPEALDQGRAQAEQCRGEQGEQAALQRGAGEAVRAHVIAR